jgi:hypothetical protein
MDRISIYLVRAGLIWLVTGFTIGALMLSDRMLPGDWRLWFAPTHGHILFVGWFLQFAVGVGYWLLPRKRSPEQPDGYRVSTAFLAFAMLNAGLLLRVAVEPLERTGRTGFALDAALVTSSILQLAAIIIIATQIWRRILPRKRKAQGSDSS